MRLMSVEGKGNQMRSKFQAELERSYYLPEVNLESFLNLVWPADGVLKVGSRGYLRTHESVTYTIHHYSIKTTEKFRDRLKLGVRGRKIVATHDFKKWENGSKYEWTKAKSKKKNRVLTIANGFDALVSAFVKERAKLRYLSDVSEFVIGIDKIVAYNPQSFDADSSVHYNVEFESSHQDSLSELISSNFFSTSIGPLIHPLREKGAKWQLGLLVCPTAYKLNFDSADSVYTYCNEVLNLLDSHPRSLILLGKTPKA